ncbi:D-alanyl-D-alanine carboxypeptidase family protein [Nostoc sp. MS1]|uniref:M15 family metallopeptidase n=1 Tax=Nostoc sp. MS1 TaxID=2764711 RepID=UPI001CC6EE57|nr:D-alanyl-D-alanine carboxypeptidase family protein [Nostoc sp. MS1]BCL38605.1 D-alanyl-D-alanine carboxypeptidase [Nostoc sp. MS1]
MNKAGFSEDSHNSFDDLSDDIPVAVRDTPGITPQQRLQRLIFILGGISAFVVLAVISGFIFFVTTPKKTAESQPAPATSVATPTPTGSNSADPETVLGHLSYSEAPQSELAPISADGRIRMRKTAAQRFQAMAQAARREGVVLLPVSGFRSVKEQEQLFFAVGAQRNQTPSQRAALSAPPGHSEHHTGYAVDIGDGTAPTTNLQAIFDKTKAFAWLQANAARFSFEMSFPKDNVQGVSYEPWHWRFVGDRDSLETFYKARNLKPVKTQP